MSRLLDPEEREAIRRYEAGEKLNFSTDIGDTLTYGYGRLDRHGFWEFPLPYSYLRPKHKELADRFHG